MWFIGISNRYAPTNQMNKYWNRKKRSFCDSVPITGYATKRGAMHASKYGPPYHEWVKIVQSIKNGHNICLVAKYDKSK